MNSSRFAWIISSIGCATVLVLAGCGKQSTNADAPGSGTGPTANASANSAAADAAREARVMELYTQWEKTRKVDLTAEEIAGLPPRLAERARRGGEILDLELMGAGGGNVDVMRRVAKKIFQQSDAFYQVLEKEPVEIQAMVRSLLGAGGLRNPVLVDGHRVMFETEVNIYDRSDADMYYDVYSWDFVSGEVRCKTAGSGVDGDWACRESAVSASGDVVAFERQFMGGAGEVPAAPFTGVVWLATGKSLAPVSTLENWVAAGGFVPIKAGDQRFFRRPVVSGDGQRVALMAYFAPSEDDRRNYGDSATYELVLMDRETKTCRALSGRGPSLGGLAMSRDGKYIAVVAPPSAMEKGVLDEKPALYRVPCDGSKPKRIALPQGVEADQADGCVPAISGDGSRIAFECKTAKGTQIYLYDDELETVTLASVTPAGGPGAGNSSQPSLSADGGKLAFSTEAKDLVAEGSGGAICVRDLGAGKTVIGSVTADGKRCHGACQSPSLSADGTLLSYLSSAEDLPGVRKPKNAPPGLLPKRLFVTRLGTNQTAILGGVLKP